MKKFLRIIAAACRVLAFIGLILWLGQLRIADDCIGGHFVQATKDVWGWTVEKIAATETFTSFRNSPYFPGWLGAKKAPPPAKPPVGEKITSADRDSLMKLLP